MTTQLQLIDGIHVEWKLDERTKEIGRRGLARARAALQATATVGGDPPQPTAHPEPALECQPTAA
jgi:hypothetical protein